MILTSEQLKPFSELAVIMQSQHFEQTILEASRANVWFTSENIRYAISAIVEEMLNVEKLKQWLSAYNKPSDFIKRRIGVVMAGNIPLVGFFDLLSVLVTGHSATVRMSSKDSVLMGNVIEILINGGCDLEVVESFDRYDVDAVIVTGSDSTVNFYRGQFQELPGIFRGTRHSVAVIENCLTSTQAHALLNDIMLYWGLGCRNVTHLFLPNGYDVRHLATTFSHIDSSVYLEHSHYGAAYKHARAMSIMQPSDGDVYDVGFMILKPSLLGNMQALGELGYSFYEPQALIPSLNSHAIQCVTADFRSEAVCILQNAGYATADFGQAQRPQLTDYADGIDVISFLLRV